MLKTFIKYFKSIESKAPPHDFYELKKFNDLLPKFTPIVVMLDSYLEFANNISRDAEHGSIQYLPFKYCSIEFERPAPIDDSWKKQSNLIKKPAAFGTLFVENDDLSISELLFVGDIDGFGENYFKNLNNLPEKGFSHVREFSNYEHFNNERKEICELLEYLNSSKSKIGISTQSVNFKRNGRDPDFVKKIVVVDIKKNVNIKNNNNIGLDVDWKHQWSVRGHWRKISPNSFGKNRNNEYSILGQTWVSECTKGKGQFVKKTRFFKNKNLNNGGVTNELV
jgi:hypothetical protein